MMFDAVHCQASVRMGDLGEKRNGLEMSQNNAQYWGLEMSQFLMLHRMCCLGS